MAQTNTNTDPRKKGTSGLPGLPSISASNRQKAKQEEIDNAYFSSLRSRLNSAYRGSSYLGGVDLDTLVSNAGTNLADWGSSKYDTPGTILTPTTNLDDIRYENQSWGEVLGNGLVKMLGTAGTTFLSAFGTLGSTVGTLAGQIGDLASGSNNTSWSDIWDNKFTQAMSDADDWFEENFKNYQSTEQKDAKWWQRLGDMNWWADDFIKNIGFTIGAAAAGSVFAGALGAMGSAISGVSKVSAAGSRAASAASALFAAAGEGAIEAKHLADDMEKTETQLHLNNIEQMRARAQSDFEQDGDLTAYQAKMNEIDRREQEGLAEIKDRIHEAGNLDMLLNLPILTMGNLIHFGKGFNKSYNNARKLAEASGKSLGADRVTLNINKDVIGKAARGEALKEGEKLIEATSKPASKAGKLWAVAKQPITEGSEEMNQQWASNLSAKLFSEEDPDDYWKARIDPESVSNTAGLGKQVAEAIKYGFETSWLDPDQWEQFAIGALTGAMGMGMPTVETETDEEGKKHRKLGFSWNGSAFQSLREYNNRVQNAEDIADNLNKRNEGFAERLRSQVAHAYHQRKFDEKVEEGDKKGAKDELDKQFVADVESFVRAGRTEDLREIYKFFANSELSDEDVDDYISNATMEVSPEEHYDQLYGKTNEQLSRQQRAYERTTNSVRSAEEKIESIRARLEGRAPRPISSSPSPASEEQAQVSPEVSTETQVQPESQPGTTPAPAQEPASEEGPAESEFEGFDDFQFSEEESAAPKPKPLNKKERGKLERQLKRAEKALEKAKKEQEHAKASLAKTLAKAVKQASKAPGYTFNPYFDKDGNPVDDEGRIITIQELRDKIRKEVQDNGKKANEQLDMYIEAVNTTKAATGDSLDSSQENWLSYYGYRNRRALGRNKDIILSNRNNLPTEVTITPKEREFLKKALKEDITTVEGEGENEVIKADLSNLEDEDYVKAVNALSFSMLSSDSSSIEEAIKSKVSEEAKAQSKSAVQERYDSWKILSDLFDSQLLRLDASNYARLFNEGVKHPEKINQGKEDVVNKEEEKKKKEDVDATIRGKSSKELRASIKKGDITTEDLRSFVDDARNSGEDSADVMAAEDALKLEGFINSLRAGVMSDPDASGISTADLNKMLNYIDNGASSIDEITADALDAFDAKSLISEGEFDELASWNPDADEEELETSAIFNAEERKRKAIEVIEKNLAKLRKDRETSDNIDGTRKKHTLNFEDEPDKEGGGPVSTVSPSATPSTASSTASSTTPANTAPAPAPTPITAQPPVVTTMTLPTDSATRSMGFGGSVSVPTPWRTTTRRWGYHSTNMPYHEYLERTGKKDTFEYRRSKAIYDYLSNPAINAFEHAENPDADRSAGDEVHFSIVSLADEIFGKRFDELTDEEKRDSMVILVQDTKGNVLGDIPLPKLEPSTSRDTAAFKGLQWLYNTASSALIERRSKDGNSPLSTSLDELGVTFSNGTLVRSKISNIFYGKPPFLADRSETHSLNDIAGLGLRLAVKVGEKGGVPVIVGEGARALNDVYSNLSGFNTGQPFMLMKDASGKWFAVPFGTPYLKEILASGKDSLLYKTLHDVLSGLSMFVDKDSEDYKKARSIALDAVRALLQVHYPTIGFKDDKVIFTYYEDSGKTTEKKVLYIPISDDTDIADAILTSLANQDIPINVSIYHIGGEMKTLRGAISYNSIIGEVSTTNLPAGTSHTTGTGIIIAPIGNDGFVTSAGNIGFREGTVNYSFKSGSEPRTVAITKKQNGWEVRDVSGNITNDSSDLLFAARIQAQDRGLYDPSTNEVKQERMTLNLNGKVYVYDIKKHAFVNNKNTSSASSDSSIKMDLETAVSNSIAFMYSSKGTFVFGDLYNAAGAVTTEERIKLLHTLHERGYLKHVNGKYSVSNSFIDLINDILPEDWIAKYPSWLRKEHSIYSENHDSNDLEGFIKSLESRYHNNEPLSAILEDIIRDFSKYENALKKVLRKEEAGSQAGVTAQESSQTTQKLSVDTAEQRVAQAKLPHKEDILDVVYTEKGFEISLNPSKVNIAELDASGEKDKASVLIFQHRGKLRVIVQGTTENVLPTIEEEKEIIDKYVPQKIQDYLTKGGEKADDDAKLALSDKMYRETPGVKLGDIIKAQNRLPNMLRDEFGIPFVNQYTNKTNILEDEQAGQSESPQTGQVEGSKEVQSMSDNKGSSTDVLNSDIESEAKKLGYKDRQSGAVKVWDKLSDDEKTSFRNGATLVLESEGKSYEVVWGSGQNILKMLSRKRDLKVNVKPKAMGREISSRRRENERAAKKWLSKNLPMLSAEERVQFVEKLSRAGKDAHKLWAAYRNGVIEILRNAPMGAVYHESFHYVVDMLLNDKDRKTLFDIARERYDNGDKLSDLELEELMAEDFRKYCINENDTSIFGRIKRWFKRLRNAIRRSSTIQDGALLELFRDINNGKYANAGSDIENFDSKRRRIAREINALRQQRIRWDNLDKSLRDSFAEEGLTKEAYDNMSTLEKENWLRCRS